MFDLTTYPKKQEIPQLKTVFSTLDTLCPSAGSEVGEISIDKDDQLRLGGWDSKISRGGGVPAPHKSSFKFVSRAAGSSQLGEPSGFSTFSRQPQLVRTMNHKHTTSCRLLLLAGQGVAGKS